MNTLESQLADYGNQQRQLHGPLTTDELALRSLVDSADTAVVSGQPEITITDEAVFDLRQSGERVPRTPQKRWAVAATVAAALLLVVGIVVADRDSDNVVTVAVSQPSVVEPAAPPVVAKPGSSLWPLVFEDDGESGMSGVVAGGPGFVAVGDSDVGAAVWTSVDGLTWSRAPHDEAVFGGEGGQGMADVTVGGPGLVAVGHQLVCSDHEVLDEGGSRRFDEDGNPEPDTVCEDGNAVVWTSVDGLTWSRVPHDEAVFGGDGPQWMSAVTVGGPGLVAVGRSNNGYEGDADIDGQPREGDAVVWTSVDGLTWSRVPHDEAVFGGVRNQGMLDVTVGGPGLVAVGSDGGNWWNPVGDMDAAVWTSVDGLTWSRVPHDEDAFGGDRPAMLSVTAGGPGLVAVGKGAAVWTSVNGFTWSRVIHDQRVGMTGYMVDVTVGGPGLVAVGSGVTQAAVWTSVDGLTWSPAANGETDPGTFHAWMWAVNAINGRLIAVGSRTPDRDSGSAAVAWMSPNP
jgi:hypothetical protein